ncbi:MAG: type II toxin-antitoxin system HicB family antitoxin [Candidatus Kaiserbacteria bacterium]|nr:type II toxin-antitoxin system HicB family antitoxin [Candidatus Kaiserbacteria bacterium]
MKKKYLIKTAYGDFYALIWFAKREKVYFVSIPAFPGVLTEARTLTEAKKYAGEVISLHCLSALDEKKIIVDDARRVHGKFARPGTFSVVA